MCAYRVEKIEEVVELRMKDGYTDDMVSKITGVPVGTVRKWTPNAPNRKIKNGRQMSQHANSGTMEERTNRQDEAERIARESFNEAIKDPLIALGIGLWIGEGCKAGSPGSVNRISIGSVDPYIIRLFNKFLEHLGLNTSSISFRVRIANHPDATQPEEALKWWMEQLGFTEEQIDNCDQEKNPRKSPPNHPNGLCLTYITDLEARTKINIWTEMLVGLLDDVSQEQEKQIVQKDLKEISLDDW